MKTAKVIGILFIVASIALGYIGVNKISDSQTSLEVFDAEIEATDKSGQQQGYIYTGLAVVLFIGGVYLVQKK